MVDFCTCVSGTHCHMKLIRLSLNCLTRPRYRPSEASWFRLQVHLYCLIVTTCTSTDGTSRFCSCGSQNMLGPLLPCMNPLKETCCLAQCTSHVPQRMPGSPPMLMIVNDVLLEPKALAKIGPNGFGRVSEWCKYTEAN
jgi:hypothetical protein